MEVAPYLALSLLAVLILAAQRLFPTRAKRIDRELAALPRTDVHEAIGHVRLIGRVVRIGEPLRAPISGRPCVAFEVFVSQGGFGSGPDTPDWRRLVEAQDARPFFVADSTGEARIEASGTSSFSFVHDLAGDTGRFTRYPGKHEGLARFLESIDIDFTDGPRTWKTLHYTEALLAEGALVAVGGLGVREPDPTAHRADLRAQPERLVLRGTDEAPLLISAAPAARARR